MSDTPRSDAEVYDSHGIPVSAEELIANDASLRQQNGGFATYVHLHIARELERELDKQFARTIGWREAAERQRLRAETAEGRLTHMEMHCDTLKSSIGNAGECFDSIRALLNGERHPDDAERIVAMINGFLATARTLPSERGDQIDMQSVERGEMWEK